METSNTGKIDPISWAKHLEKNIKKRIYIAGKVTDEDWQDVKTKFAAAEEYIRGCDCEAVNPTKINNEATSWHDAMRTCIAALMGCDVIYCLPCWVNSRGARLERFIAGNVGIEIIDAPKF